jgi:putative peptidoglycan lipid II flippase
VLPAQIGFVTGGVVRAALMASDRFWTQAAGPLVYNLGIIAGGLLLAPEFGAEGFAWGALAGALLGPLILPLVDAGRSGLRLGFRVAPWDRDFGAYLWRAAPLILGLSVLTVDEWYDRYFGQFAGEGAIAALGYARIVMVVPVALLGQAVATAMLPALSRLWSQGRGEEFDRALLMALRAAVGLALLAAAGTAALAEPTVALLYQRGAFSADDTARVASLLVVFAFAVPGMVALQVAGRGFFAREDMWRPMLLGTVVAAAAIPLYAVMGRIFAAEGLAASGAITMTANAVLLLLLLRRRYGGPPLTPLLGTLARGLLLAALAGAAAGWAEGFGELPLARLLLGGAAFAGVAIPGIYVLGDEAMREAAMRVSSRLRRRRG